MPGNALCAQDAAAREHANVSRRSQQHYATHEKRHASGSLYGKTKRRRQRTVPKSPRKYEKTKRVKDSSVRLPLTRPKPAALAGSCHRSEFTPITEEPHRERSFPENAWGKKCRVTGGLRAAAARRSANPTRQTPSAHPESAGDKVDPKMRQPISRQ